MLSVNKTAVDRYLANHPEFADKIASTAKTSFANSFFKHRKNKV